MCFSVFVVVGLWEEEDGKDDRDGACKADEIEQLRAKCLGRPGP